MRLDINKDLDQNIVFHLQHLLHENHSLIEGFKTALENAPPEHQYEVVIRADKRPTCTHERVYV